MTGKIVCKTIHENKQFFSNSFVAYCPQPMNSTVERKDNSILNLCQIYSLFSFLLLTIFGRTKKLRLVFTNNGSEFSIDGRPCLTTGTKRVNTCAIVAWSTSIYGISLFSCRSYRLFPNCSSSTEYFTLISEK